MPGRKITLVIMAALIIGLALSARAFMRPVLAQSTSCKPTDLIAHAAALKSTGDSKQDMLLLQALASEIEAQNIACNGFSFAGKGGKIIGPIDLPKGTFKMTVTTKGYFTADMNVTAGTCTNTEGDTFLYDLNEGEANTGADTMIQSDGCHTTIEADTSEDAWTLVIEPAN